jgi:hypothetical protein
MKELWSDSEVKNNIIKFENILDNAKKAGIDVTEAHNKLENAIDCYIKGDIPCAQKYIIRLRNDLADAVEKKWPTTNEKNGYNIENFIKKYTQFILPMYGFWVIIYSVICLIIAFFFLIYPPKILHGLDKLGIAYWAPLFGVIGSSIQIMLNVAFDVKHFGYVVTSKRLWYFSLTFMSFVFGMFAYVLFYLGFMGDALSYINTTTNASLISDDSNTTKLRYSMIGYIACFLAGYSTDWFKDKLKELMK